MATSDLKPPENSVSGFLRSSSIFLQNACLQHRYIRSKDLSNIVERPERLRAVNIGLSAAIARIEELFASLNTERSLTAEPDTDDLAAVMDKLKLDSSSPSITSTPVLIVNSQASSNILSHPAVKFVHGDIDGDVYLENLSKWIKESHDKISEGRSEIPDGYSQGDLYLCPGSLDAIQGAVGTVCEAVDRVVSKNAAEPIHRAFVAIRPPGHHCGEDTPSGFCFLNNVSIGAAHAHLQHGMNRIVIFDIDLHHGNGTQSIVWQINEETYRQTLESEAGASNSQTGPKIYYGSLHDVLSYPCEDGKVSLVQAASVSLHKSHGQYIENVHLQTYTSEQHFWDVLYKEQYSKLLDKAQAFLDDTGGPGDDVLFFISCGMDACEHEYESMSRHNRKVPTSFYHRFARDACALSDKYAGGKLISVLEGGYSDLALTSGAMAHLSGLVDVPSGKSVDESWWNIDNLTKLQATTKKKRGGRPSMPAPGSVEPWLERTLFIFGALNEQAIQATGSAIRSVAPIPRSDRTLRDRTKGKSAPSNASPSPTKSKLMSASTSAANSSKSSPAPQVHHASTQKPVPYKSSADDYSSSASSSSLSSVSSTEVDRPASTTKKLPKVILRLGKAPETVPES